MHHIIALHHQLGLVATIIAVETGLSDLTKYWQVEGLQHSVPSAHSWKQLKIAIREAIYFRKFR